MLFWSQGRDEGELNHSGRQPVLISILAPILQPFAPPRLCVKKTLFAKQTQIENHNSLPISRMHISGLASFPKRTHLPSGAAKKSFLRNETNFICKLLPLNENQ
jgi:hypothetical protein